MSKATFSRTGNPSSPRWGAMRCFTTTPSRPGASTRPGGSAMSSQDNRLVAAALALGLLAAPAFAVDFGRPATPDEVQLWDIDVTPDAKGLRVGSGTVAPGKQVFADNCAA